MPPAPKADPKKKTDENFRARRLSVTDIDTSEFSKANTSSPSASGGGGGGSRQRRASMSPEMGVVKPKNTLPFEPSAVGTYSCHGVEPGMRQGEAKAKINQDRGSVVHPFGTDPQYKQALFCVYDGHGALGDKVSHYVMNNVQDELEKHPTLYTDPEKALKETFVSVDERLKKDKSIDAELSGTTAVVVLYRQKCDSNEVELWSACCGDSRATLFGFGDYNFTATPRRPEKNAALKTIAGKDIDGWFVDLTVDQKPDTPAEMARIKKKGGFVSPPEEEWGGPARVWLDANMTLPGLAMARSLGDHLVSEVGVVAEPVVEYFKLEMPSDKSTPGPIFIAMASDGVWEFIESHQACSLVQKFLQAGEDSPDSTLAVTKLIETAAAKWRQEEGDYRDDITAIVIRMRGLFDAATPL